MSSSLTARLPDDIARPLKHYCEDAGVSKTVVVVSALREFLATHKPRPTVYELALPLIPKAGLPHLQAKDIKHMLREKFRASSRGR